MGILSGNPKEEPLHYGEVFALWSYLFTTNSCISAYQTLINHVGDGDLKKLMEEVINACQNEVKQIEIILKENEVGLPPTPPERPHASLDEIPVGARFLDNEVSAKVGADIATGLVSCSTIIGESIREDIAVMFGQFHTTKATLAAKSLRLNKEKGWITPPPLHKSKAEDI
ncbi:DUF3231 family protein [Bacillus kwashiorkori]|uniref:DUF3231 family protein n=1 Tax=Bacillus kwashiorkori TaxID=1522318 RepID=UPI0007841D4C|nr:DUF3231 family protein [Bacillus kwashiorkori]